MALVLVRWLVVASYLSPFTPYWAGVRAGGTATLGWEQRCGTRRFDPGMRAFVRPQGQDRVKYQPRTVCKHDRKWLEPRAVEHVSYGLDRRTVMDVRVEGREAIHQPQLVEHCPVDIVELVHMADEIRGEKPDVRTHSFKGE